MSKKLIGASIIALLFSSVCFANIQGTSDTNPIPTTEMKVLLLCDGHEGNADTSTATN